MYVYCIVFIVHCVWFYNIYFFNFYFYCIFENSQQLCKTANVIETCNSDKNESLELINGSLQNNSAKFILRTIAPTCICEIYLDIRFQTISIIPILIWSEKINDVISRQSASYHHGSNCLISSLMQILHCKYHGLSFHDVLLKLTRQEKMIFFGIMRMLEVSLVHFWIIHSSQQGQYSHFYFYIIAISNEDTTLVPKLVTNIAYLYNHIKFKQQIYKFGSTCIIF